MPPLVVILLVVFVGVVAGFAGYSAGHNKGTAQKIGASAGDRILLKSTLDSSVEKMQAEAEAMREAGFIESAQSIQASSERLSRISQKIARGELEAH